MKKTIFVKGYPASFTFETQVSLPEFSYGCDTRTELVQNAMRLQKIRSPHHEYADYIVEIVEPVGQNDELWHLGS